jgi:hypothetical protein
MADVMDLPVKVVSFQEEARECLQLAEAELPGELRTILMGMARGWLELGSQTSASHAISD